MVVFAKESDNITLLKSKVRETQDFPRKGVWCQDVTPIFNDPVLFKALIQEFVTLLDDLKIDIVCGVESRGFMFGPPLAKALGARFVPISKYRGKPDEHTMQQEFTYVYGDDMMELPVGAVQKGKRVIVVDDQIVTGGSALGGAALVERMGGVIAGICFILTQTHYEGLPKLKDYDVYALFEKNPAHE